VYSYHCLLVAEQKCLSAYRPLEKEQRDRVVVFEVTGWALSYKRSGSYWQDSGNPVIVVNLLGRVSDAAPAFVMQEVNKFQGSNLQP